VEGALFAAAVFIFVRGRRFGLAFWGLVACLGVVYLASVFGPPPPHERAVALSMILAPPLLWWWGNKAGRPTRR
jgi:hypothetical protein